MRCPIGTTIRPGECPFLDERTGLCWQNPAASRAMKRQEAIDYCDSAADQGFTDWRLPSIDELESLLREDATTCHWDPALT